MQDKQKEIAFFDRHALSRQYNVFTEVTNRKVIQSCIELAGLKAGDRVGDLGCGSGVFTELMRQQGMQCFGLDISHGIMAMGQHYYPDVPFVQGDIEALPLADDQLDGLLLSGIIHHFPDKAQFACEVYRVLKPGGVFVAFDPNRRNPFMWLYRDKSSPLYSSVGVTENERPILPKEVESVFNEAGFRVTVDYLSGIHYQYIASSLMRRLLPVYNFFDDVLFRPGFMKPYRSFVLTRGVKS